MNQLVHNAVLVEQLSSSITEGGAALRDVPGLLKKIIREEAWRERVVRQTGEVVKFVRFAEFLETPPLEGMGAHPETIKRLCTEDAEALDLLDSVWGQRQGERTDLLNNIQEVRRDDPPPQGTSRQRAIRRLRKEAESRPEVAELRQQVLAGEVSPHAAMVQAGLRPKTVTIQVDPERAAATILRQFEPEQVRVLIAALQAGLE